MTADEMFEKLGYKNIYKRYVKKTDENTKTIKFNKDKQIKLTIRNNNEISGTSILLSLNQLKAINQKCKELGWII